MAVEIPPRRSQTAKRNEGAGAGAEQKQRAEERGGEETAVPSGEHATVCPPLCAACLLTSACFSLFAAVSARLPLPQTTRTQKQLRHLTTAR
jgi:hypothetical protein